MTTSSSSASMRLVGCVCGHACTCSAFCCVFESSLSRLVLFLHTGAMVIICDMNEYRRVIKEFKVSIIKTCCLYGFKDGYETLSFLFLSSFLSLSSSLLPFLLLSIPPSLFLPPSPPLLSPLLLPFLMTEPVLGWTVWDYTDPLQHFHHQGRQPQPSVLWRTLCKSVHLARAITYSMVALLSQ